MTLQEKINKAGYVAGKSTDIALGAVMTSIIPILELSVLVIIAILLVQVPLRLVRNGA